MVKKCLNTGIGFAETCNLRSLGAEYASATTRTIFLRPLVAKRAVS
jgi:hypothetical protein